MNGDSMKTYKSVEDVCVALREIAKGTMAQEEVTKVAKVLAKVVDALEDDWLAEQQGLEDTIGGLEEKLEEMPKTQERAYRDAYVDGYVAAVRQLEMLLAHVNGYTAVGQLQDHVLKLQMWQISSTDKKVYAPILSAPSAARPS